MKHFFKKRSFWIGGGTLLAVLLAGAAYGVSRNGAPELAKVTRGDVIQNVQVSGRVVSAQDLDLAFEQSGKVRQVYAKVGATVRAGEALVVLDQSTLLAERAKAAANLDAEVARLAELERGSRPEEIRLKETALSQAKQDLAAEYAKVIETLNDAYNDTDDAIRREIDALFTNDEKIDPKLSFDTTDYAAKGKAEAGRVTASSDLKAWRAEIDALSGGSPSDAALLDALAAGKKRLAGMSAFLNYIADALNAEQWTVSSTLATYKTSLASARSKVTGAQSGLTALESAIAADALAVKRVGDDLALANAGSASEVIQAQEARVAQTRAALLDVDARLAKTILRAPIAGIITKQEAKVGQIAAANETLVSMISESEFEIEANVPEVDIGQIQIGNTAAITLDAFPGETFTGTVASIDPAETLVNGVVNFEIKVVFQKRDPRVKSGMTANLTITTLQKTGVLALPQDAIREDGEGTFVLSMNDGKETRTPVKLGTRGQGGTVEILSGLSEGDEVVRSRNGKK